MMQCELKPCITGNPIFVFDFLIMSIWSDHLYESYVSVHDQIYLEKKIATFLLFCNLTSGLIWAALIHSFSCGCAKIFIYYWFNLAARAALHSLVKDFIRKRREDEEKAEKLFIDSLLDCDFMDEDEVCLYLSFFRLSLLRLFRCGQSNESSSAVLLHDK